MNQFLRTPQLYAEVERQYRFVRETLRKEYVLMETRDPEYCPAINCAKCKRITRHRRTGQEGIFACLDCGTQRGFGRRLVAQHEDHNKRPEN